MGTAEKEDIHRIVDMAVERSINKSMKPIQWSFGIACLIITCFVGVMCWPVIQTVMQHEKAISNLEKSKIDSEETYKNFITKNHYFYLQKEEHKAAVQAIINPKLCHDIYESHNGSMAESLEIRYRGVKQIN